MPRLTLRTLLAYIDDTLPPDEARDLGRKVAESEEARALIDRIKKVTRRRRLTTPPPPADEDDVSDPNTVAEYLSDALPGGQVRELEETCLGSDVHLAEVAACHQILTLVLTEPVRVPPSANQRMYKLVEAPASDPRRKPGKALPVGGVGPPAGADADDPDAALLLGLRRYAASDSWAGRVGLVAAVGGVAAFLAVAVLMALPRTRVQPPEASPVSVALAPVPPTPGLPVAPDPKPADPGKKPDDPGKDEKPADPKDPKEEPADPKADPGPKLGDPVAAPLPGDAAVGRMETDNVVVLTRGGDKAAWTRVERGAPVRANDPVLALPGYKADVKLDGGVTVHLWGNTPEQVPTRPLLLQSRVRFHPPAPGFAADLTLDAGRVYLTGQKPGGAKVRLRVGPQVWDVGLRGAGSEVLAQVGAAFDPDTPFTVAPWDQPMGGESPRAEARLVVTRGAADLSAPRLFKKVDALAAWTEVVWDSKKGGLGSSRPAKKEEVLADRNPLLVGDLGKVLQRAFSDLAKDLAGPDGTPASVRVAVKERLVAKPPDRLFKVPPGSPEALGLVFPARLAVYAQAALADGPDAADLLRELVDLLRDRERGYARQAAVLALSDWVARAPGNTDALVRAMVAREWLEEDAQRAAHLLRGYGSAAGGEADKVDDLVRFLDHPNLAVREAALGNLLSNYDPEAARVPELFADVAARGQPGYDKFLKAWEERAKGIKERMTKKE